jgi:hypothetical protein
MMNNSKPPDGCHQILERQQPWLTIIGLKPMRVKLPISCAGKILSVLGHSPRSIRITQGKVITTAVLDTEMKVSLLSKTGRETPTIQLTPQTDYEKGEKDRHCPG